MQKVMKFFVPMFVAILVLLPFTQADEVSAASTFEDGEYNISMSILSESGEKSTAMDFLSGNTKLTVNDGKNTLQVTIEKNENMVKEVEIGGVKGSKSGSTLTFNNIELSETIDGSMHIKVPDLYDTSHNVTYKFNNLSDIPTKGGKEPVKNNEETTDDQEDNNENGANKNNDENGTTGTTSPEDNPQTGDNTPVLLLTVVLLASGFILVRRVAFK